MVAEIIELLAKDYSFVEIRLFEATWDIYVYGKYSGITIQDGDLGVPEEYCESIKKEIDYYIKVRQFTFLKAEAEDKAKVRIQRKEKDADRELSYRSRDGKRPRNK
jgi:hypothetical protein